MAAMIWIEKVDGGAGEHVDGLPVQGEGTARFRYRKAVRAAGGDLGEPKEGAFIVDLYTDSRGLEKTACVQNLEAFRDAWLGLEVSEDADL